MAHSPYPRTAYLSNPFSSTTNQAWESEPKTLQSQCCPARGHVSQLIASFNARQTPARDCAKAIMG
jgi:hypothetical protein